MTVTVRLFSVLCRAAGESEFPMQLPEGATAADAVRQALMEHSGLQPFQHSLLLAVNEQWSPAERPLREGDVLALMPPVSGG